MSEASRPRRVTGADVAREAGVSRATVSYVLNDTASQKISETTRLRVLEAVARLGYAPSASARSLRKGRSDIVLGLLPDWPIEHVLGRLVQRLTSAFAEHGLTFLVYSAAQPARPVREIWKALTPAAVLALDEFPESEADAMRSAGIDVVMAVHGSPHGRSRPPLVSEEPIGAAQARHLAAAHRRLGYACPDLPGLGALARSRLEGVRKVCAELGLPEPDVRVVPFAPEGAMEAVRAWRSATPPVTGICAFNDAVALSVLVALRSLDLRVPDDMAVIGVDGTPAAALAQPPLTTVVRDTDALARELARRVVDALDGGRIPVDPLRDALWVLVRASA